MRGKHETVIQTYNVHLHLQSCRWRGGSREETRENEREGGKMERWREGEKRREHREVKGEREREREK